MSSITSPALQASWARQRALSLEAYREAGPLAVQLKASGASLGEIARALNAAGWRVRRTGGPWSRASVRHLLKLFLPWIEQEIR